MSKKIFLKWKLKSTLRSLLLIGTMLATGSWIYLQHWLNTPLNLPEGGYTYELQSGQSLGHLVKDLGADQVLRYPRLLDIYARTIRATKVQAGEYFLAEGTTPATLLAKLKKGEVVLYQVTFLEGWTLKQALATLAKVETVKHLLSGKSPEAQLAMLDLPVKNLEGWIFPDTYSFIRNTSDVEILRNAYRKMAAILEAEWAKRSPNLPYKDPYQALIMASIIERETGHHSERDQIAGVFVRRLQQGMKLQTDPTVIYGMGDTYTGKIGRKNLSEATAYNTYIIDGLPPTPISLPSIASIRAALNPASGKALYFVAKGDGSSEFSDTLEAHNEAVARYQLRRRQDYRSTPTSKKQ